MNVEIGTKTPIFLFWEYLFRNFGILPILPLQCSSVLLYRVSLTVNAPLILKMQDIIFFAGKLHNGPFQGIF
jgi:hypothetical protein